MDQPKPPHSHQPPSMAENLVLYALLMRQYQSMKTIVMRFFYLFGIVLLYDLFVMPGFARLASFDLHAFPIFHIVNWVLLSILVALDIPAILLLVKVRKELRSVEEGMDSSFEKGLEELSKEVEDHDS